MPCIIVFSATISVLCYLGVMQVAINAVTAVMRVSLDTGPMETLHAAFNIFVGWAEAVPVVQPLLDDMTLPELHAVMTNGFATVSGGTLAAYILYGYIASYLMWPFALLMGVEVSDCRPVARMLGIKVFINEYLAFENLGVMRSNNLIFQNYSSSLPNATWHWTQTDDVLLDATGQVLKGGVISVSWFSSFFFPKAV
ncbi:solute carrier family 28 member 3 [Plakobranchus ocellatus]|uniref:Solute carrier family 28 member 3 n=1 Tax=Plakobranchus ocellatus TaxID=259542 RepID=A0AAV4CQK0_9GAST|nr:solute carrier family 28 member 3 [Plakobranchus ocellatus]